MVWGGVCGAMHHKHPIFILLVEETHEHATTPWEDDRIFGKSVVCSKILLSSDKAIETTNEPLHETIMKKICIYCGSSDKISQAYLDAAFEMGRIIAQNGLIIIYGAGSTGMMGAVANGALEAGGEVWGVIPKMFDTPQLAHKNLTRYEVTDTMHTRKARMAELADGFIALPGGFGTFEELFEIITWAQIGVHRKPIGLLNTRGYYDFLLGMANHAAQEGFLYQEHLHLFSHAADPASLLEQMMAYQPPEGLARWVERDGKKA